MTIIEVRPHRGGWQAFEAPGVQPYYTGPNAKQNAIDYALGRSGFRRGEVRVMTAAGEIEETIAFDQTDRRL